MALQLAPRPAPTASPSPRPRIFSGIQPSGIVHLGNDLGAIRNYVKALGMTSGLQHMRQQSTRAYTR